MPRSKPFSGKKKREQMKQKRAEKQGQPDGGSSESDDQAQIASRSGKLTRKSSVSSVSEKLKTVFAPETPEFLVRQRELNSKPLEQHPADLENYDPDRCQLPFPTRPSWSYDMDKTELERNEEASFTAFLEQIYTQYPIDRLNFFEHNLEVWRQLWRVLEISDVAILVSDVRCPLMHLPAALLAHLQLLRLPVVIVLNKADLVPPEYVRGWQAYLGARYPGAAVVPFSCFPVRDTRRRGTQRAAGVVELMAAVCETARSVPAASAVDWERVLRRAAEIDQRGLERFAGSAKPTAHTAWEGASPLMVPTVAGAIRASRSPVSRAHSAVHADMPPPLELGGSAVAAAAAAPSSGGSDDSGSSDTEELSTGQSDTPDTKQQARHSHVVARTGRPGRFYHEVDVKNRRRTDRPAPRGRPVRVAGGGLRMSAPAAPREAAATALPPLPPRAPPARKAGGVPVSAAERRADMVTVAMIGHPNVGKSAVLNALMGAHVVSVKGTPGHTKHLQTHFVAPNLRLCDCPGLVFPALDMPRPLQVLMGVYPVARARDPVSAVRYLAERLPLPVVLGLPTSDPEGGPWSAARLCEAFAEKKGFRAARSGRADSNRVANLIVRMAYYGRIVLAVPPPDMGALPVEVPAEPIGLEEFAEESESDVESGDVEIDAQPVSAQHRLNAFDALADED